MKYALVEVTINRKENKRHYSWISLSNGSSREDDIMIIKQEISYLREEINYLQDVSKLLGRRKTELKNFENLLKLMESQKG